MDNGHRLATFPRTMKSESLNGILTYVLGVLVVLAVYFALKVVFLTRESRSLQAQEVQASARMAQTDAVFKEAQLYNQKYQSPDLTRIIQSAQSKSANH